MSAFMSEVLANESKESLAKLYGEALDRITSLHNELDEARRKLAAATMRLSSDSDLVERNAALEVERDVLKRALGVITVAELKKAGVQGLCAASAASAINKILANRIATLQQSSEAKS